MTRGAWGRVGRGFWRAAGALPLGLGLVATVLTVACNGPSTGGGQPVTPIVELSNRILLDAARQGRAEVVQFALDRGAAVEAREAGQGRTALALAAEGDHIDTMALLLARGADPGARSANDWTPLFHAAANDRADAVRLLLTAGAQIDESDRQYGYTPVMVAALLGHLDTMTVLLDLGADLEEQDRRQGETLLSLAASGPSDKAVLTVAELLVRGLEVDGRRGDGATPLMAALDAGNDEVARLLLDEGAAVDAAADDGTTALTRAAGRGNLAMVRRLLQAGAVPTAAARASALGGGHGAVARALDEAISRG